jgi:hypothetical protein
MGAADDLTKIVTKAGATFTRQRKAEEKQSSAGRWRESRMREVRGVFLTEAANEVMEECYMKVSDNGSLPATARQIFYVARPLIEERTDKPLSYSYFSQTLLPDYVNENAPDWDVVYDDRGHFLEPHSKRVIGLGTLNVRGYLSRVEDLELDEADFSRATVKTYGPDGSFGALLYVEKEGFMPLFKEVKLAKRYDIASMSSKGMSVTAARVLVDAICGASKVPLLVLHDCDAAGMIIKDTLEKDTRRYSYSGAPKVIDIGLNYEDIGGLSPEDGNSNISAERLSECGLSGAAIDFLSSQRVELNAMTSRQLVDFVEGKLKKHRIGKVIPDEETLAKTYQMFAKSGRLEKAFEETKKRFEDEDDDDDDHQESVPENLEAKVKKLLKQQPDRTWHRAVELIVNPDATEHEDDEADEEEADDDSDDEG